MNFILFLQVAAFVFFILAAFGIPTGRLNTIGAGLACLTAAILLGSGLFR